ncbi:MAG: hypothetical protein ACKPKO_46140, partial [Candidatus Fonsibacter sp.]
MLRSLGTVPRLLADGLEILSVGFRHASRLLRAADQVAAHSRAMGSNVSTGPGKSHSFASSKAGRRAFRQWAVEFGRDVLGHWKYFVAHANITGRQVGVTLTRRLGAVARLGPLIRALPCDLALRTRMVTNRILPMGVYGTVATYLSDVALWNLRGAFLE